MVVGLRQEEGEAGEEVVVKYQKAMLGKFQVFSS